MTEKQKFMREALQRTRDIAGIPTYSAFGDGEWFYTAKPISWTAEDAHLGSYSDVHVPIGFVTDLASIPRPFWTLMPRDGNYLPAAIIHDYLYWMQDQLRKAADDIFNIAMSELNVSSWKRITIHKSVRIAGGKAWNKNADLKEKGERRVLNRFPQKPHVTWADWKKEQDIFADDN